MHVTCTLGPASSSDKIIAALLKTADRFRLNSSHLTAPQLGAWLKKLRRAYWTASRSIPVVVDLQGAKMRIGRIPETRGLPEKIKFVHSAASSRAGVLPVPHAGFFEAIREGDELTLNDARVRVRMEKNFRATVVTNGPLSSFKGVNRPAHPLPYPEPSRADLAAIRASLDFEFTQFAFSFVHDGTEAAIIKPLISGRVLAAKIERPDSMKHLAAIANVFDELWLCRGDLGAQAGIENLGPLQEEFIRTMVKLGRPACLAGQVLEHMSICREPTRSEVVHLYDAARAGFSGIVLSDETAIGRHPAAAALAAYRLCKPQQLL